MNCSLGSLQSSMRNDIKGERKNEHGDNNKAAPEWRLKNSKLTFPKLNFTLEFPLELINRLSADNGRRL